MDRRLADGVRVPELGELGRGLHLAAVQHRHELNGEVQVGVAEQGDVGVGDRFDRRTAHLHRLVGLVAVDAGVADGDRGDEPDPQMRVRHERPSQSPGLGQVAVEHREHAALGFEQRIPRAGLEGCRVQVLPRLLEPPGPPPLLGRAHPHRRVLPRVGSALSGVVEQLDRIVMAPAFGETPRSEQRRLRQAARAIRHLGQLGTQRAVADVDSTSRGEDQRRRSELHTATDVPHRRTQYVALGDRRVVVRDRVRGCERAVDPHAGECAEAGSGELAIQRVDNVELHRP